MMFDAYAIPQDEYFEWDDVIQNKVCAYPETISLLPEYQMPTNCYPGTKGLDLGLSDQSLPLLSFDDYQFNWAGTHQNTPESETVRSSSPFHSVLDDNSASFSSESDPCIPAKQEKLALGNKVKPFRDDTFISPSPLQNVDYLSHDWHRCEEDIWATIRYLKSTKSNYDIDDQTYERLSNACWRALPVGRLNLKKVNPRSFNWLKDQDVTWLHGPFISHIPKLRRSSSQNENSEQPVKSNLKKPSLATILSRGSIPPSSPSDNFKPTTTMRKRTKSKVQFSMQLNVHVPCLTDGTKDISLDRSTEEEKDNYLPNKNAKGAFAELQETSKRSDFVPPEASALQLNDTGKIAPFSKNGKMHPSQLPTVETSLNLESVKTGRVLDEVSPSRYSLRDMMESCQRGLGTYYNQSEISLWPIIIT